MAEIAVLARRCCQRVARVVVGAAPLQREVEILRDVAAQRYHGVVAHVAGVVDLVVDKRRRARIAQTGHKVEVALDRVYGESVAQVRAQRAVAVEIGIGHVLQRAVLGGGAVAVVDLDILVVVYRRSYVVLRELRREHPHERASLRRWSVHSGS